METDTAVLNIQKKYGSRALMLAIGTALFFLILGQKEICRGLVLGGIFSTLNFTLMGQFLRYRLSDNQKSGAKRSFIAMMVRYILLAIPLILSVRSDKFNFPATVVGIFMVQLVIMIEHGSRLIFDSVKH
jgi:hypothetical protein